MHIPFRRIRSLGAAAAATGALLLTGCSTGFDDGASGPVELTYWAWAPNLDQVVDIWNEDHPEIQVTVSKQDGGDPAITKLLTAVKAGSGAPDLVQAEYQKIPTLVAADALADISDEGAGDLEGSFSDGTWSAVTLGGDAVYAIPQDSGPMMAYYRADILESLGLGVPTTWEEYAAAAEAVHASDPARHLGTFSSNDAGWFAGLAQQAGASWWSTDDRSWGVDIDAGPTEKVAAYWGELVESGAIGNTPMYTPEWNAGLNDGSQVGWISAVWAPGVLSGNAPDTKGAWIAAALPQWDAANPSSGNWGGSTTAVTSQTKKTAAAAEFATWLNTDPVAVAALAEVAGVYPAATEAARAALSSPPDFFSTQGDFSDIAAAASESVAPFTYGPNVNVAFSAYNDEFAKAAAARTRSAFVDAVAEMQRITSDDLVKSGFSVE
ncbi:ABC transporter substrate-binding protein [Rathayibacter sp. AY1B5]|uniref:ABC transporter substrate-binding protein n=1 Tax=Rathayibacter sp. AY1B5 TaxID=2080530 RepID=UPI000CE81D3B|nr:extracellular solute-binding protein [Rathayibacter sp. AY1B5]PPI23846.1 sugar ABC transporter substrate-binding protein [Rathayibacter sp. AY1B5]